MIDDDDTKVLPLTIRLTTVAAMMGESKRKAQDILETHGVLPLERATENDVIVYSMRDIMNQIPWFSAEPIEIDEASPDALDVLSTLTDRQKQITSNVAEQDWLLGAIASRLEDLEQKMEEVVRLLKELLQDG